MISWRKALTGGKPRGTDGTLLKSLSWTLLAVGCSMLPHLWYLPLWIMAAFAACAAWRYWLERWRRPLPPVWVRAVLALSCFAGVLLTFKSISGVGPGSALLAIMAGLKLLETRQRRDQFVLLFIAIFLVMSSLLREQFLWSLPYLLCSLLLILTAWIRLSASGHESARQSFASSTRLLLYAAPLAVAMWVFFPRIATPFWAVPIDTSRGMSGISDTMSPGDISALSQSDEVAFRVRFNGAIPTPRLRYWRGLVLYRFDGRSWSSSEPGIGAAPERQFSVDGKPVEYEVTMEPTAQQWVFALDLPRSWTLPSSFMGPQQQLESVRPIDQRVSYDVVSFTHYHSDAALSAFARSRYTTLPARDNPKTTDLARRLRSASVSDRDYIEKVLQMFRVQPFYYTLQPPPLGRNPVDDFLFKTRRGFCEHYASAFAVLMRAAGIPARIVLGYQGGEVNPLGGHMIVRQSDAHAWTEVWLPDNGWTRVDPTAAVAPERIDEGRAASMFDGIGAAWGLNAPSEILYRMELTWDALNAKWNDLVLGYGPENQSRLMQWLGMRDPSWRKLMLTLVGSVVALTVLISSLLMFRYRPPRRDRAAVLYARFVRRTGLRTSTGETPLAFADRASCNCAVPLETINTITAAYLDARYGTSDAASLDRLKIAVTEL